MPRRTLARFVGKVMLVMEALQPAMMYLAADADADAADAAQAADGDGDALEVAGSQSLAAAWTAALRDSPAGSRRASGQLASREASAAPATPQQPREALINAWAEAAADVREALDAVDTLVAACGTMGRLQVWPLLCRPPPARSGCCWARMHARASTHAAQQRPTPPHHVSTPPAPLPCAQAVLEAEEQRERFAAAALDLKVALTGLQAVQAEAPADVAEDLAAVQRQLAALRFSSSVRQEQLTGQLLEAAVLLFMRQVEGPTAVAPLLAQGIALAGLDAPPRAWLDFEVRPPLRAGVGTTWACTAVGAAWCLPPPRPCHITRRRRRGAGQVGRLRDGAAKAVRQGDPITAFFYKHVVMCLLAHLSGSWEQQEQVAGQLQAAAAAEDGSTASEAASPGAASPGSGDATSPEAARTPEAGASHAARFRHLMGTWQSSRSIGSPGPSPQQAPAQPSPSSERAPLGTLSGAPCALCTPCCAVRSLPSPPVCCSSPFLLRLLCLLRADEVLSSLLTDLRIEDEEPLRALDPEDVVAVVRPLRLLHLLGLSCCAACGCASLPPACTLACLPAPQRRHGLPGPRQPTGRACPCTPAGVCAAIAV